MTIMRAAPCGILQAWIASPMTPQNALSAQPNTQPQTLHATKTSCTPIASS
jgi:hypothetical protein